MSITNILLLLKFQLKAKFKKDKNLKFSFNAALLFLAAAVVAVSVFYVFLQIIKSFHFLGKTYEFLVIILFALQLLQIIFTINAKAKSLYNNSDTTFYKYIPISVTEIFVSKLIMLYLSDFIFMAIITVPILVSFAIITSSGVLFYLLIPLIITLLPVLPLVITTLVSYAFKLVSDFFKSKFILKLVLMSVALSLGFYVYAQILLNITSSLIQGNYTISLSYDVLQTISNISSHLFFHKWFANILLMVNPTLNIVIVLGVNIALLTLLILLAKKFYKPIIFNEKVSTGSKVKIVTKNQERSINKTIFVNEVKNILRSSNYAFQSFGIAITMPLMTLLNAVVVDSIVTNEIGSVALVGLSVFIMAQYITFQNSYVANVFSRNSNTFYITKIVPLSYKKHVTLLLMFYFTISMFSILISSTLLLAAGIITFVEFLLLVLVLILFSLSTLALNIKNDIKHFKPKTVSIGGEYENKNNFSRALNIGSLTSILLGAAVVFLSYNFSSLIVLTLAVVVMIFICFTTMFMLYNKLNIKIYNLEIK